MQNCKQTEIKDNSSKDLLENKSITSMKRPRKEFKPPKNGEKYILDLIERLKRSWAAGVPLSEGDNFVSREEVLFMVSRSVDIMKNESTVLELSVSDSKKEKLTVIGDTHGQFYDLLTIFKNNGMPSKDNIYLFNGDYVDRGPFSFQVIFLLLCLKSIFPNFIFLLRGNHESEQMNKSYGFFDEIVCKYDREVVAWFWRAFRCLPLAAEVSHFQKEGFFRTLVVHGGICVAERYEELRTLNRIDFNRLSTKKKELVLDILWSDPQKAGGRKKNRARGAGSRFGPDETRRFLETHKFDLLVRSHQVKKKGFSFDHDNLCLTLFSCPNYCDRHANKGAYLVFSSDSKRPMIVQFSAVDHPPLTTRAFSSKL